MSAVIRQLYLDIDGAPIDPPKARSFKAIVRSIAAALHRPQRRILNAREQMAVNALKYVLTKRGEEVAFGCWNFGAVKLAEFDRAPDGSVRVRAINLDGEKIEIPHWDFVPEVHESHCVFA